MRYMHLTAVQTGSAPLVPLACNYRSDYVSRSKSIKAGANVYVKTQGSTSSTNHDAEMVRHYSINHANAQYIK